MISDEVLPEIQLSDLPYGDAQLIASRCGLHVAIPMIVHCSGISLYLPKKCLTPFIRRYIKENKTRFSPKELAFRLGVSDAFVYQILRENEKSPSTNNRRQS